jgi:hypothetical protein
MILVEYFLYQGLKSTGKWKMGIKRDDYTFLAGQLPARIASLGLISDDSKFRLEDVDMYR